MFIQTEDTPNPATLKFLPGRAVVSESASSVDFVDAKGALNSPLAMALFKIDGVEGVFLGPDFISVTKNESSDWKSLKPKVLAAIMEHFSSDRPTIEGENAATTPKNENDSEAIKQIRELLDTRVRPAVAQDGGDIVFHGYEDGVVYLKLRGACAGCPSATATLKIGVEGLLKHYIPEVREVRQVK